MDKREYTLTDLEVSDLFFNHPNPTNNTLEEQARDFLNALPSLENQGVTVEKLVSDYEARL